MGVNKVLLFSLWFWSYIGDPKGFKSFLPKKKRKKKQDKKTKTLEKGGEFVQDKQTLIQSWSNFVDAEIIQARFLSVIKPVLQMLENGAKNRRHTAFFII